MSYPMRRKTLRSTLNRADCCLITYQFSIYCAKMWLVALSSQDGRRLYSACKGETRIGTFVGAVPPPPPGACCLVAAWPLELDMRRELLPFEPYVGSSCLTDSHISTGSGSRSQCVRRPPQTGIATTETGYEAEIGYI